MRNCEPYNEVSKKTLNPYYLQQGTAPFDDKEYKRSLFNFTRFILLLFLLLLRLQKKVSYQHKSRAEYLL